MHVRNEWTSLNFSHIPFGKQDAFLGSFPSPAPAPKNGADSPAGSAGGDVRFHTLPTCSFQAKCGD